MMRTNIKASLAIILINIFLLSTNVFSQDPNFHIYLCFGQSNMEGVAPFDSLDLIPNKRFLTMNALDCDQHKAEQWRPATPPLTNCFSKLGPIDYFGRTMVQNLPDSIKIGVIVVAVGGTRLELFDKSIAEDYVKNSKVNPGTKDWLPQRTAMYNDDAYGRLIELAQKAQKDGVIKGILMHQGESNYDDSLWAGRVIKIYGDILNDLNLKSENVPFLLGEMVLGGIWEKQNKTVHTVPSLSPTAYVVPAPLNTGVHNDGWNVHFSSEGYRKLGYNYASKMLSLLGYDVAYFEPECASEIGKNWTLIADSTASNHTYIISKKGLQKSKKASKNTKDAISFPFDVKTGDTYHIYGRVKCPTKQNDSFWIAVDKKKFTKADNLVSRNWEWKELYSTDLPKGKHTIKISYCEGDAMIDKICIKNSSILPKDLRNIEFIQNSCEQGNK